MADFTILRGVPFTLVLAFAREGVPIEDLGTPELALRRLPSETAPIVAQCTPTIGSAGQVAFRLSAEQVDELAVGAYHGRATLRHDDQDDEASPVRHRFFVTI